MRVAFLIQRPQRRGVELFTTQLASEMRRRGLKTRTVALFPGPDGTVAGLRDETDVLLDGVIDHPCELLPGVQPSLLRQLRDFLREFKPDVLQVSGGKTVKYGALSRTGLDEPRVVVWRNAGMTSHWLKGLHRQLYYKRLILPRIDGVVNVTDASQHDFERCYSPRVPMRRIFSGVDPEAIRVSTGRWELRRSLSTGEHSPVMLFIGSLSPEKRPDRFLGIVHGVSQRLPETVAWIVGDGPLRADMEARGRDLAISDRLRMVGTQQNVGDYLRGADVLVLTSDTEGSPRVIMEAGLTGLPVVATRVGGVEELVKDRRTGRLCDAEDETGLVAATVQVLTEPELANRLRAAARTWMRANVTISRVAEAYEDFYRELLNACESSTR